MLVVAWRWCSFGLFVAAALLLSPIVWLDYYALTAVPLAVVNSGDFQIKLKDGVSLSATLKLPATAQGPIDTALELLDPQAGWVRPR